MGAVTKLEPRNKIKDGDGDDNDNVPTECIMIKPVSNGWIITTSFEDADEVVEVFDNDGNDNGDKQAVECILESMGLENDIKIR